MIVIIMSYSIRGGRGEAITQPGGQRQMIDRRKVQIGSPIDVVSPVLRE